MTLSAIPASSRVSVTTSKNDSPPTTASRRSSATSGARPSTARSIALSASHGPRGVPARPVEHEPRDHVPEAPGLDAPSVGSRRIASAVSCDRARAREERGQRVVLGGKLLAAEEEQPDVVRARLAREIANELERDREPAFHVARAEPVHCAVGDPPGRLSWAGTVS